jgi:hypothetical protein
MKAAETGCGVFEMNPGVAMAECRQFTPIIEWVTETPAAVTLRAAAA